MNIIHVETFLTVCACGNISEAAKLLFVPQPTVSNRIRFIEESLGHELFVRSKRGVVLTEQGRIFLPHAERILETYKTALRELNRRPNPSEISIGSSLPFTFPFILDKLEDLYKHNPNLNLQMLSVGHEEIARALKDRRIDMAFTINRTHGMEVEEHEIGSEALQLVFSRNHPLAEANAASTREILARGLDFVVCYQKYYEMFENHPLMQLPYQRRFLTNHAGLIKQMIMRMNAVSFLPLSFIANELQRGELTYIPFDEDERRLRVPYYLLFRRNERLFEDILLSGSVHVPNPVAQHPLRTSRP